MLQECKPGRQPRIGGDDKYSDCKNGQWVIDAIWRPSFCLHCLLKVERTIAKSIRPCFCSLILFHLQSTVSPLFSQNCWSIVLLISFQTQTGTIFTFSPPHFAILNYVYRLWNPSDDSSLVGTCTPLTFNNCALLFPLARLEKQDFTVSSVPPWLKDYHPD